MNISLAEACNSAFKKCAQIFKRHLWFGILMLSLLATLPTHSLAQTDPRCSVNGGPYQCLKANIKFLDGGNGIYLSGEVACQSLLSNRGYPNIKYWTKFVSPTTGVEYGQGCSHDEIYMSNVYTVFHQNEILTTQSCGAWFIYPPVSTEKIIAGYYDETDTKEDPRGRFWCIYAKPPLPPAAPEPESCQADAQVGNPIIPATGEKILNQIDYTGTGPNALTLDRSFRSNWARSAPSLVVNAGLGQAWSHNHAVSLVQQGTSGTAGSTAKIQFGNGTARSFSWDTASNSFKPSNSADTLTQGGGGLLYKRLDDDSALQFDAAGRLITLTQRNGWLNTYTYSSTGQLTAVSNQFGRSISFAYNAQSQLTSASTPDGQTLGYQYDSAGRLSLFTAPGAAGSTVNKSYVYENSAFPLLLTGVVDEAGNRLASYAYDTQGRGIITELAGGANRYGISYASAASGGVSSATVTDPLGTQRTYNYGTSFGKLAVTGADKPSAGSGSSGGNDAASRVQDSATGLITQETDFLGVNTMFTWDINRRLPLSKTAAAGRPEAQTVSTQWHPSFRLPVLVTEAGRSTASTYDSRGNLLTQSITDTATNQVRTWAWTYGSAGSGLNLIETMTEPTGGVWRYAHDNLGNRISSTNPLGQITRNTYDPAGRVTGQTEPNGLVSSYAYDARGRLTVQTRGLEATNYSYHPTGQLASATLPNGYQVSYSYDAAQRLIAAQDNRGALVQYTLDAMGNRVNEVVKDSLGNIALASGRIINNLNRVASLQGALGQPTQLAYDANGQAISQTDPLSQTIRQTLDGLRRPVATAFADNASTAQTYNQLNQLTQVTDPKGVATTYTRNVFGDVMQQASPDTGAISYQRNANGEVTGMVDAKGNTTAIVRDALGRPQSIQYAPGHIATFSYDSNQTGYLSQITDKSGSTRYERDAQGRITAKVQTVNDSTSNPSAYKTTYSYTPGGQLAGITYPSGLKVTHSRSSSGQIVAVNTQAPGLNKPIIPFATGISYTALNQPKAWAWASGDAAARTFDGDGRMTSNEFAAYTFDAASRITGITQNLWASRTVTQVIGTATTVVTQTYLAPLNWQASYDSRNRLVGFNRPGSQTTYTYDANSNRLSSLDKTTSDTDLDGQFDADDFSLSTSQVSVLDASSNKLLGFSQTLSKVRGTRTLAITNSAVNYSLDANGNLTSDGLRSFDYDEANRLSNVKITKDGEAASLTYLTNALGQRTFKGEPKAEQYLPNQSTLGTSYIDWLKRNFAWLFAAAQTNTSVGTAFTYSDTDAQLPSWALLGEYDNGSASGSGRSEYIWLPTEDGSATPIGMYRSAKLFAVHTDHLGTPRLVTNEQNTPVWQWPYSAFGNNKPTGILKATANPISAVTNNPVLLRATAATEFNLRFPGQYADDDAGNFYNYFRNYQPNQGRYTQADPIGLEGGLNRFGYVNGNALGFSDPLGLNPVALGLGLGAAAITLSPAAQQAVAGAMASTFDAAGKVVDAVISMCKPDDPCESLITKINIAKNGVARRFRQLAENTGGIDQTTHWTQVRGRQKNLRDLLDRATAMGCQVPPDAWYWATK